MPPGPVRVNVYVAVAETNTDWLPDRGTDPMLGEIVAVVASREVQCNRTVSPGEDTEAGVAVREPDGPTLTVTEYVVVPPGPVSVSVYFVADETVTAMLPDRGTDPMSGEIVAVVASREVHCSRTVSPGEDTEAGVAVREPDGPTLTVTEYVAVPPGPVSVSVYFVVEETVTALLPETGTDPIVGVIAADVAFCEVHCSV